MRTEKLYCPDQLAPCARLSPLQPAVASGATAAICSSIARVLDELPGGDRTQVRALLDMGRLQLPERSTAKHVCVLPDFWLPQLCPALSSSDTIRHHQTHCTACRCPPRPAGVRGHL